MIDQLNLAAIRFMAFSRFSPNPAHMPTPLTNPNLAEGWQGDVQQGLARLQFTILPYCIAVLAAYSAVFLEVAAPKSAHILAVWCASGLLIFALVLSQGWSSRLKDPSLIFPQVLFGCGAVVLSYTLLDVARPLGLLWLCLLMLFDIHRLTTRQLLLASLGSLTLMCLATVFHDQLHDTKIDLVSDWISLGTGAIVMPVMRLVSMKSYKTRHQILEQRASLAETVASLERASVHDSLTGLINRRYMQSLLEEEIRRLRRTEQNFCLAIIDLDHFKQINDHHGHAIGDAVLRGFAQLAQVILLPTDRLARWGGEEFLLLMPETSLPSARQRLDALQEAVREHDWPGLPRELSVSFSAGLCEPGGRTPLEHDLERADRALYKAKAQGRAQTLLADRT